MQPSVRATAQDPTKATGIFFLSKGYFYFQFLPTHNNVHTFHMVISMTRKITEFFTWKNLGPFPFNFLATLAFFDF